MSPENVGPLCAAVTAPKFQVETRRGTLPLAVTLATEKIYQAFYDDWKSGKAFLHSHSYTGNALACAAALATLEIFGQQDWMAENRNHGHLLWMSVGALPSEKVAVLLKKYLAKWEQKEAEAKAPATENAAPPA